MKSDAQVPIAVAAVESSIMAAAALLFFVYLGFEEIANLAEEVRNPGRDIPIALFVSLAITTLLYVAVSFAVLSLAPPAELAASDAPLAAAVQKAWPGASNMLSAIALFATANTVLITVIATSRVAFSMARDKEISSVFARLLPVRQTPWLAAILTFAMAAVLVPIGSVKILAELSSFAALIAFFAVNVVLIVCAIVCPNTNGHFEYRGPSASCQSCQFSRLYRLPCCSFISNGRFMPLAALRSLQAHWHLVSVNGLAECAANCGR